MLKDFHFTSLVFCSADVSCKKENKGGKLIARFHRGSATACSVGALGSIPGWGSSPGERRDCPLQYSWASPWLSKQRSHPQCGSPGLHPRVRKIPWRRERLPTPIFLGFPGGLVGKEAACSVGALGSIPGWGRSPGEGRGSPPQYSGLENPMDRRIHGVAKSRTRLSDFR